MLLLQKSDLVHVKNQLVDNFEKNISVYIKREDTLHPLISGNKYRKLKYNLLEAQGHHNSKLLTFGGAFSNHIAATAAAGKLYGLETIGIIRGEELCEKEHENPTLKFAKQCGMQLEYISRTEYRKKEESSFIKKLEDKYGKFYLVPEGGTNALAVKGCTEILLPSDSEFDYIACAVGTGGTIAGIIESSAQHQKILGFPALNGDFLSDAIAKFTKKTNWELVPSYTFGGYAKVSEELILFLNAFYEKYKIPLDPIYTGKMVFGICQMVQNGYFQPGAKILLIHSGGLQGIEGMNTKLKTKKNTLIAYV